MKKKIKDLTQEERDEVCNRFPFCTGCPADKNHVCMIFSDSEEEVEVEIDG